MSKQFPPLDAATLGKAMRRPRFVRPAPAHLHRQVEREDARLNASEPADLGSIIAVIVLLAMVPWAILIGMVLVGWLA